MPTEKAIGDSVRVGHMLLVMRKWCADEKIGVDSYVAALTADLVYTMACTDGTETTTDIMSGVAAECLEIIHNRLRSIAASRN